MSTVLEDLRLKIIRANDAYWNRHVNEISDVEYDKLIEKLRKLSPNDALLNTFASDNTPGTKVRHQEHMYSLAKIYDINALHDWMTSVARSDSETYDLEPKMDGNSVELFNGRLLSRGDGEIGTDISHILPYVGIIMDLSSGVETGAMSVVKDTVWGKRRIVGELLIFNKRFARLKTIKDDGDSYKTPRNMAAALTTLKPDQIRELWERANRTHLATIVYHDAYAITRPLRELDIKSLEKHINKLRGAKDLPCDGVVVKLHDREYAKSLGCTSHHQKGFVAFKFSEEQEEVVVKNIAWQVGEQHVTPVCEFDPVELDGVMINRATGHCAQFLKERNLCVGSTITIIRQGGVIPKVINVSTPKGLFASVPEVCPDCGQKLREEGAFVNCVNKDCPSRIAAKIVRGLNVLGIKGVGPVLARKVVGDFYFRDLIDFANEIRDPEVLVKKNYTASEISRLNNGITRRMEEGVTASVLLKAMCIEEVGDMFVTSVNKYAGGVIRLMQTVPIDAAYDALINHPGINLAALTNFMVWAELNKERFNEFLTWFKIIPEETNDDGVGSAEGVICMSGQGPKPRSELAAIAKKMGFAVTDNANLYGVLVCADPNSGSSKLKKAKAKGKLIMSYEEFFKDHLK